MQNEKKGPGTWKLNVSHLLDDAYKEGIKNIIKKVNKEHKDRADVQSAWEYCKVKIKEFSQKCGKAKKDQKKNWLELENEMAYIDTHLLNREDNELLQRKTEIISVLEKY